MNYKIAAALALLGATSAASAAPGAGQTYFE